LTPHEEYLRLGRNEAERQSAYRELFQAAISTNDLAEIRECTHKGWALGSERFKEQIEALGQRRATSKGVGRPKRENNPV
jgi:putative transposase